MTRKRAFRNRRIRVDGRFRNPLYNLWRAMLRRCYNKLHKHYERYGGRGITVCERWLNSVDAFTSDMGPRPQGFLLDRIDNDKGYEPGNCRWASARDSSINRAGIKYLTIGGETMCVTDWGIRYGLRKGVLGSRLRNGWDLQDALTRKMLPFRSKVATANSSPPRDKDLGT